jgi:peptidoglycan-N-acetylglucosamine deacetylase
LLQSKSTMGNQNQIFQTDSALRWNGVKWTSRVILFIILFFIAIAIVAVVLAHSPNMPEIETKSRLFENETNPLTKLNIPEAQKKKYKGIKSYLESKDKEDSIKKIKGIKIDESSLFIRSSFYSPANNYAAALSDLQANASKLNMVFPEWFFFDLQNNQKINLRIDSAGLAIMKENKLKILPMLTNFNKNIPPNGDFDGNLIHDILTDAPKRKIFISNLIDTLTKYNLQGINIDFEKIIEKTNEPLSNFQKELYETFHARGLLVTQDVAPLDEDYNFEKLKVYNDYLILMAYDQFSDELSGPGPISGQKWIEEALDDAAKKIPANKLILGIAGYGYDWSVDNKGKVLRDDSNKLIKPSVVTYSQALDKARLSKATVDFDNDNYNLHYTYSEEAKGEIINHVVWFTCAATTYNIMRFADEYGTAGTALWVIGKEDERMWNFYNRSLTNEALQNNPFDYTSLYTLPYDINQKPTAIGEGELLRIINSPQTGIASLEIDSAEQLITEQVYTQLPSGYVYEKFAEDTTDITQDKGHKIILTFDDGPSEEWTPRILDILEKEKVPATFFVVGINTQKYVPLLQRIFKDSFEIANHTYTHSNIAKMSPERAELEMRTTRLLIESITGRSTILFRAPFNADSEPQTFEEIEPIARSKKDNYITVGESIDPNDWDVKNGVNADSIFDRTKRLALSTKGNIILLHDAGGNREATIQALPRLIKYFRDTMNCKFTTVADLMGKTKDDVMPFVDFNWKLRFNKYFTVAYYWISTIVFALFLVGIFLSISRILIMALLATIQKRREKNIPLSTLQPGVSIIVPAYNEEINAVRTIESLLLQDYPNLQIVFVDDGSKDNTFKKVSAHFANNKNVQVVTKQNGGKATALNYGINIAIHDFVVCIDADTQLKKDAVSQLMKRFYAADGEALVGAVAGNVKVGNEINVITRWQSIEYTTSQNFDRSAFDLLNCITVIPGAIGAFRKSAVLEAGGFTTDTLAEDCDLTMRMHRLGYKVRNCRTAIAYTEAPETFKQFLKQRFRWSFGVMQSFWKHRDAFFNPKFKNFGMVALPHILIFQMVLPFLAPLADLILVLSLIAAVLGVIPASLGSIVTFYLVFTFVDMTIAAIAFRFENEALQNEVTQDGQRKKEDYKKLLWLFPQQLIYRQLMYYILIKSFSKALKGELQGWGVLKRTGNVGQIIEAK